MAVYNATDLDLANPPPLESREQRCVGRDESKPSYLRLALRSLLSRHVQLQPMTERLAKLEGAFDTVQSLSQLHIALDASRGYPVNHSLRSVVYVRFAFQNWNETGAMNAACETDQVGFGVAAQRPRVLRLAAGAVLTFLTRLLAAERQAEQIGSSAWNGEPCPFSNRRLIRAFQRGQQTQREWFAAISDGPCADREENHR